MKVDKSRGTEVYALKWKREKLRFRNTVLDAWVASPPNDWLLGREREILRSKLPMDTTLISRQPTPKIGPPETPGWWKRRFPKTPWPAFLVEEPDTELWKIRGLGSFDSIRFAKEVFNSPDDSEFLEGADSLEAIIAMLAEGFAEGEFKLGWVCPISLLFDLTKPNAKVTRKQYAILDKLNKRFFGGDAKTADMSAPSCFLIGQVSL